MPDDTMQRRDAPVLHRRAQVQPSSWNAEARTVDVVWTTGADVQRRSWWSDAVWIERLQVSAEAIDLTRLNGGAPVLNAHGSYDLTDQIGVVESASIANGEGRATLRLSAREDLAGLVADIAAGIIRNISVGYTVENWDITAASASSAEIRTATRWTPYEISFVPIPADAGAQTRAHPATLAPGD
jgi:hypothetical protein